MHAQVVLFDGFDLLDAVAPYEVLWAGGMEAPGHLTVEFAAFEGPRAVPSGPSGVTLAATAKVDPSRAQVIIVPGAAGPVEGDGPDTIPMLIAAAAQSGLASILSQALSAPGVTVATVCGGSLVLGLAGLITGRNAVTHHLGMEILAASGANAIRARVVDDGNLISAGGVTSGLDLGVYLLEKMLGPSTALAVESLFAYERRGTVWSRP